MTEKKSKSPELKDLSREELTIMRNRGHANGHTWEYYVADEELRRRNRLDEANHAIELARKEAELMKIQDRIAWDRLSRNNGEAATGDRYGEPLTREEWSEYKAAK